jgi:hypothetical protein
MMAISEQFQSLNFNVSNFNFNIIMGLTKEMSSDAKKKQKGCSLEDTCEDEFYIFQVQVIAHSKQTIIALWKCLYIFKANFLCIAAS